jgi:hypothetical protein
MRKLGLKFGARALSKNLFMMKNGCFTWSLAEIKVFIYIVGILILYKCSQEKNYFSFLFKETLLNIQKLLSFEGMDLGAQWIYVIFELWNSCCAYQICLTLTSGIFFSIMLWGFFAGGWRWGGTLLYKDV